MDGQLSAAKTVELWNDYWEKHPHIIEWHAHTAARRRGLAQMQIPKLTETDERQENNRVQLVCRAKNVKDRKQLDPIALFLFFAQRTVVTAFRFSLAEATAIFRFGSPDDVADEAAIALHSNIDVEVAKGSSNVPKIAGGMKTLTLTGPAIQHLAAGEKVGKSVPIIESLFKVFGKCSCTVKLPNFCVMITFLAEEDGSQAKEEQNSWMALLCLQVPLALDWGLVLTYSRPEDTVTAMPSTVVKQCKNDGNCALVNDRSHQQQARHTCTNPVPCPWINNTVHLNGFRHH